jgi:hypothetical protein
MMTLVPFSVVILKAACPYHSIFMAIPPYAWNIRFFQEKRISSNIVKDNFID